MDNETMKMVGEAILYSSIQFAIGSVEMSSKFSVKNFSKDTETLNNAIEALYDYLKIAIIWTIGVSMLLYSSYGIMGLMTGLVANLIIIMWIYFSYIEAFKVAANKYGLSYPTSESTQTIPQQNQ
jgi:hypothetical protein